MVVIEYLPLLLFLEFGYFVLCVKNRRKNFFSHLERLRKEGVINSNALDKLREEYGNVLAPLSIWYLPALDDIEYEQFRKRSFGILAWLGLSFVAGLIIIVVLQLVFDQLWT